MRSFCLTLLLVFLPLLVTQAQTPEAPEQLLARAVELHQAGELENAIRAYQGYRVCNFTRKPKEQNEEEATQV